MIDRVNKTVDIMRSLDRQLSNMERKIESTRSEETQERLPQDPAAASRESATP